MNNKARFCVAVFQILLLLLLSAVARPQGDFAEVNSILNDVVLNMPNLPPVNSMGYSIELTEIVCRDLFIRNAVLNSQNVGQSGVQLSWSIQGLAFICNARYKATGLFGMGNTGDVYINSRGNNAVATATVSAPVSGKPPTSVTMNSCNTEVQIVDIDFENGGFIGWVLDAIEGLLRDAVENMASEKICEELQTFLEVNTKELLEYIAGENVLGPYLTTPLTISDYSQHEESFLQKLSLPESDSRIEGPNKATSSTELLNLQEQNTSTGRWINELIRKGVDASNELVTNPVIATNELRVNQWLRDFVLEDGALVLTANFPGGGVLYDDEDKVTHTKIILNRVKLLGLDTLTAFSPFEAVGDYTLETNLAWKYLALELDATMMVKPSTRPDAMIESTKGSTAIPIVEEVKILLGVDGLEAGASLMTALNRTALENSIEVGSLLQSRQAAIDCLLSTLLDLEFSTMSIQITNDVLTPVIEGLVSPGLDRLVSQGMDASFLLYEQVLMEAAPAYFQNELRPMLTEKLLHEYILRKEDDSRRQCVKWAYSDDKSISKTVDFRDLFLPVEESVSLGGSGSQIYGDVLSGMVMPYINNDLLDPDALNTQFIPAMTKEQSGKEGVLEFNNAFRYLDESSSSPLYDKLDFRISKISLSNLDTVEGPLEFLQPTDRGNILQNRFALNAVTDDFGNPIRYLNATVRFFLGIVGEESPFQMANEVDVSLSIPSTSFSLEILADLEEKALLEFPMKDIANPYCWLAALNSSDKNDEELAISSLSFSLSTFYLDSYCIYASSPGCDTISEVIGHLQNAGFAASFRNSIIDLVEGVIMSLWDSLNVEEIIKTARIHCPHSESYNPEEVEAPLKIPSVSGLSQSSSEAILAFGIIGVQIAIIVSAKNHLLLDQQVSIPNNQLPVASSVMNSFPDGEGIIDWTNLSGQFGGWISILFDEFRESLSRDEVIAVEDDFNQDRRLSVATTPGVNLMLRDYVLNDSGNLEIELQDMSFTTMGVTTAITKVLIGGLDTIKTIEPLVVLDPYEMRTILQLEELTLIFECDVTTVNDTVIDGAGLVYKAKDVILDFDMRIALNSTEIGQIQVGSLFDSSNIGNCLMRGIQAFEISKLNLIFGELESSEFVGSFSSGVGLELGNVLDSLHYEYQNDILSAVPLIAGSTMRNIINSLIPNIAESRGKMCVNPPDFPIDGLVDFRELLLPKTESQKLGGDGSSSYGDLFQMLYEILDKEVMQTGASNRPVLNDLLKKVTEKQSNTTGTILIGGSALETQSVIQIAGLRADLRVEISDILIQNLDSVGDPLYFLRPVQKSPYLLDNKLSFAVDSEPLKFQGTLALSIDDGAEMNVRNEIYFSFSVKDVTIQASILLKLMENSISLFPLEDLLNVNCWAATILPTSNQGMVLDGIQIFDQVYSTGDFEMEISCKSCSSPDFDKFLLSLYEPDDITAAVREQTGNLMDSDFVQRFLTNILLESKKRCPHHPEFDPKFEGTNEADSSNLSVNAFNLGSSDKEKNPMYFSIANSVVAGCFIVLGIIAKLLHARRNKKWIRSLTNEGQVLLHFQQEKQRGTDEWLDDNTTSLFESQFIPKSIRWGVPFLLVINTVLYLWGHFGLLSVMNLDITFAGQSFTIEEFMQFRFFESTQKTYENGGAEMIILLWICSGIWPYIKILLSLTIWMAPPKYLSVKRRRSLILWIDALARLSIIDIFTLIIAFAILLVFIGGRDKALNEEGMYYAFKAIIVPKAGCYCIIAAQRMSRVSSQFFLDHHEKLVEKANHVRREREGDMSITNIIGEDRSRENNSFEMPHTHDSCQNTDVETAGKLSQIPTNLSLLKLTSWKAYRWGQLGAILGGITILIVFVIGLAFVPAIALDISSVGGIALESDYTYEEAVSEYGVFLVISGILVKARFVMNTRADYIGLGLLLIAAGLSVGFIFIIKAFHFIKRKVQERRNRRFHDLDQRPSYGHEGCGLPSYFRLYKWNHMEIFFISLCIGVWQLGSIISYSIHLYCSILTDIFDVLVSIGITEPTEAQCNRIQASLPGNLVITIGSFLILLAVFYLQARGQYKKNLLHASKYIDDKDVPTLSLGWSQDKSKNKRYSHLTESLSFSVFDSDASTLRAASTLATNPSDLSHPQTSIDSRTGSSVTESSYRTNTTARFSSSRDTIHEDPDEIDIAVPMAPRIFDVESICSDRSSTIDAPCRLVNTSKNSGN